MDAKRRAEAEALGASGKADLICRIPMGTSCGSAFHEGLRFVDLGPSAMTVFYLPERNAYRVFGKALVYEPEGTFKQVVEDGEVAMSLPPDHSSEEVRKQETSPELPADVKASREAKDRELRSAGAKQCSNFGGRGGMCGSPYHAGIIFENLGPYGMALYYLPDRNAYYVMGKARVYNMSGKGSKQVVEDGEIAAPGPPQNLAEPQEPKLKPTPPDVKAARDAKAKELEATGGIQIAAFNHGMCGSPYHQGVTFKCTDPFEYGFRVFYMRTRNAYYVIGRAAVSNATAAGSVQTVEDTEIAAPGPPEKTK